MKRVLATLVMVGLALGMLVSVPQPPKAAAYTPPPLKVAVVVSQLTDDWSLYNKPSGTGWIRTPQQHAVAAWLKGKGWNVTEVGDDVFDSLTTLNQYDVVVLAHVIAMNMVPSKNLQAYVRDGGGLVAIGSSPRVAPEKDTGPTVFWPESWASLLNGESAEWGPMSEVYQVDFMDDQFRTSSGADWPRGDFLSKRWPNASHPILDGASQILKDRGYPSGDYTYDSAFQVNGKGAFELVNFLSGNRNVTPLLTFKFRNPESAYYPKSRVEGNYPAAVATRYNYGKCAYFFYAPTDALVYDACATYKNPSGVPDKEAAGAMLESAIQWAGTKAGSVARITRGGKTWASLKVYGDGIYANQYVENDGNVASMGQAFYRVYSPSGTLLVNKKLHVQNYVSNQPGQVRQYAWSYRPGGQLANGKYRVEVEFVGNYPWMNMHHVERVYVTRSQGLNIPTVPVAAKVAGFGTVSTDPNPFTPNGDGWNDLTYVNYTLDQPARVTVKLLDMWRRPIATAASATNLTPGPHAARIPTKRSNGAALTDGQYYVVVEAANSAGWSSKSALMFVSHYGKATALGTTPRVASVSVAPSPFTPNGDGAGDTAGITVNATADSYAVVKVLNYAGEVRTVANNARVSNSKTFTWDGKDSAGRAAPAGNYRYYVVVHGGGTTRQSLFTGTLALKR